MNGVYVILPSKTLPSDYKVSLEIYAYLSNKLDMHLQWSALSQSRGPNVSMAPFGDVLIATTQAIQVLGFGEKVIRFLPE